MNRLGVLAQAAALSILTVAAGWWFVGVFVSGSALVPLVLMVAAATVVLLGVRVFGVPPLLLDLFIGGLTVVATMLVIALSQSDQPVADLSEGLINGWARVLTTALPVAGRMDLLVVPLVVVGLATVAGLLTLLRSRSVWLPVAPLLVVIGLGLAFGNGAASQPWWVVVGIVGGSSLLALLRSSLPVSESSLDERVADEPTLAMPALGGFAALAGAVGLAVLLTGPTPLRDENAPFTLRDYVAEEQDDLRLASPLSRAEELAEVDTVMTIEAVTALPAGTRVRVASLETYDGLGWSPADRLEPVGSEISGLDRPGTNLDVIITPEELGLPWVPTIGEPTDVQSTAGGSGTVLLWSPISGNIATPDLSSSDGTAWQVSGVVPAADADQLALARLNPGFKPDLGVRAENKAVKQLQEQADEIAGADPQSFAAAARLLNLFKNKSGDDDGEFAVDPEAVSSPALGGVINFMEGRVGNRFQFATSYATVAQLGGIPARVAVGAKLDDGITKGSSVEVSGADLTAWPEVNISGLGWTALDPVPDEEGSAGSEAEEQLDEATDEAATADPDEPPPPPEDLPLDPDDAEQQDSASGSKLWIALLAFLALGLGIAAAPFIRLLRRRKRRSGSPTQRTAGAWAELMDLFVEEGEQRPLSATPSETAALLGISLDESGSSALHELADLVERSVFSPSGPDPADADRAWALLPQIRQGLGRSAIGKVRAALAPGPLSGAPAGGHANTERDTVSGAAH